MSCVVDRKFSRVVQYYFCLGGEYSPCTRLWDRDSREAGICIIDAGHYGLEHIFMEDMEKKIKKFMPRVAVYRVPFAIPVQVR